MLKQGRMCPLPVLAQRIHTRHELRQILILALGEITQAVSSVSLENPVESFASMETPQGGSHGTFGWGVQLKFWFRSTPCFRLELLF